MKLEALDHPKTLELAAQLQVELPTAIGYLELLWAFVAKKTPRGDIGKWSDGVIAGACLWRGKAAEFVQALVSAGFIDHDGEHRLLVHDWHEHCPNWVRAKLKKDRVEFALKSPLKSNSNASTNGVTHELTSAASNTASSRADLNQGKAREGKPSLASTREDGAEPDVPRGTDQLPSLSPDFDLFLRSTFPETAHRRDFDTALHSAMGLVSAGLVTEDDLRRRVTGYREFVLGGGVSDPSKIASPQRWMARHQQGEPYWAREWAAPAPIKPSKPEPVRTWRPDDDTPEAAHARA